MAVGNDFGIRIVAQLFLLFLLFITTASSMYILSYVIIGIVLMRVLCILILCEFCHSVYFPALICDTASLNQ